MSKCWNCGLQIADPSQVCPLCKCIVEKGTGEMPKPTYPYAEKGIQKMQKATAIYLFAAILTEIIIITVNVLTGSNHWWAFMVGIFLVYTYVTLRVSVQMNKGYRFRFFFQALLGVAVVIALDYFLGFHRWSLNYVLPAAFLFLDLFILLMMIINNTNWQSYMPLQMLMIAFCVIPCLLLYYGITTSLVFTVITTAITVLFFLGTLIVGGSRARTEMYRRFHA